jgi:hypothetical protein
MIELTGDLSRHHRKIAGIITLVSTSSTHAADLCQKRRTELSFDGLELPVEGSNRIDQNV